MDGRRSGRWLTVVVAAALGLSGCGAPGADPSVPAPSVSASASVDPVAACAHQLDHWVQVSLDPDSPEHDYDYQGMGLTGSAYEALLEIVREAERSPTPVTDAWVHERTTAACRALQATPRPTATAGGWPG